MYGQVPQKPLIEHFTQASCSPCMSQDTDLKTTLDNFGEANYVRITHHVSWPGVDPMNADFPSGSLMRRTYYSVIGVPSSSLNGGTTGSPNTIITSSSLNTAFNNVTPYSITATQSWANQDEVTINIDVKNVTEMPISNADKIYVIMLEKQITFISPPGTNNQTSFEYVMRQMYNASNGSTNATSGTALGEISGLSTTNFNFTITNLPSYLINKSQVVFAVYIQNDTSKQIYQSETTNENVLSANNFHITSPIKIFSNLSSNFIKLSGLIKTENYKIYNINGKIIKSGNVSNYEKINIENYSSGIYLLKFEI